MTRPIIKPSNRRFGSHVLINPQQLKKKNGKRLEKLILREYRQSYKTCARTNDDF